MTGKVSYVSCFWLYFVPLNIREVVEVCLASHAFPLLIYRKRRGEDRAINRIMMRSDSVRLTCC
jgi:hypothetical protein